MKNEYFAYLMLAKVIEMRRLLRAMEKEGIMLK